MKYSTMKFNDSSFISLTQFVSILYKAFKVIFYKENQYKILHSYFYQRLASSTKNHISDAESLNK